MTRLPPLADDQLDDTVRPILEAGRSLMGFVPNDGLTMARNPALLTAFLQLVQSIYAPGGVSPSLKRMIGLAASNSSECAYCVAHTANSAARLGVPLEKLRQLCDFENSTEFSAAERAAIRLATRAAQVPNAVRDEDYECLRKYYDENEQVEILAVISLFGFLNRWNSTLATDIETAPQQTLDRIREPPSD